MQVLRMIKFNISMDTCADLRKSWCDQNRVGYLPIRYIIDGKEHSVCFDKDHEFDDFYELLKKGAMPTTAQLNPYETREFFEKLLSEAKSRGEQVDHIHLPLSSGLSNTHDNAERAASELNIELAGKADKRRVHVFNTLSATLAQGELVMELVRMRDEGMSGKEIYDEIERIKHRVVVSFILDSVEFLYKGGRCTGLQALGANLLGLHPVISVDNGTLKPGRKYRGALANVHTSFLTDSLLDSNTVIENDRILIANTSFSDESNEILRKQIVKLRPDLKEIIFVQPGCSICVHCGSNTVGYSYLAKEK